MYYNSYNYTAIKYTYVYIYIYVHSFYVLPSKQLETPERSACKRSKCFCSRVCSSLPLCEPLVTVTARPIAPSSAYVWKKRQLYPGLADIHIYAEADIDIVVD